MSVPKEKEAAYADKENESTVFLTCKTEQKPLLRQRVHRNAENPDGREMAGGARLPHRGRHTGGLRRRLHPHLTCTSDAIRTCYGMRYKGRIRTKIIPSKRKNHEIHTVISQLRF